MNHKKLQDVYVFKKVQTPEITFVNSTHYQFSCELGPIFNKSIVIKNDSTLAKSRKEGHYLIDRVLINGGKIELDISYKTTGLKGTIHFVRKGSQKYKIARYEFGFF
jgi:hypothetical protein